MFFKRKYDKLPKIEFSGITLENPLGCVDNRITPPVPGFLTLTPPKDGILDWISQLQTLRKETVLAVNLRRDIQRSFALLYDFVDFIIVDTGSEEGTAEVSDITALLDELLSLRLCYERYTRILVRITGGLTNEEILPILDYCRMSGIDGVMVSGQKKYKLIEDHTGGRLPVIFCTDSPQEAIEFCSNGTPVETSLGRIQRMLIYKTLIKK